MVKFWQILLNSGEICLEFDRLDNPTLRKPYVKRVARNYYCLAVNKIPPMDPYLFLDTWDEVITDQLSSTEKGGIIRLLLGAGVYCTATSNLDTHHLQKFLRNLTKSYEIVP